MEDRRTKEFQYLFSRLPPLVQLLATASFKNFAANPAHPGLDHHQLDATKKARFRKGSCSVHISRRYVALYVFAEDKPDRRLWYWIGTHEEFNNLGGKK